MHGQWKAMVVGLVVATGVIAAVPARSIPRETRFFDYRIGFWNSLHHFLYVLGRAQAGERDAQRLAVSGAPTDTEGLDALSARKRAAWREAVDFYEQNVSPRNPIFDGDLIRTTLAVVRAGEAPSVEGRVEDDLATVLDRAGPIYREVWWDRHRAEMEARIAQWKALLERHGAALTARLSDLYRLSWPEDGVRIEVVAYANWAGAYSTGVDDQSLIVVSALYDGHEGLRGIEASLHESLHQGNEVGDRIHELSQEHDIRPHDWLAHGLIFYTTGEIVREVAPEHVPNAVAFGVWDRVGPELAPVFDEHWRPYMEGETTLDEALLALLRALEPR